MPVTVEKKQTTSINITLPSGTVLSTTLYWSAQDEDAEFVKKMVEYADGTADKLREQNRQLKDALSRGRVRAYPGTDQRQVVERDFPEL